MSRRKRPPARGPYLEYAELLRDRIPDAKAYPYHLPVLRALERLEFHPSVTYFVGENGSGKSTLMEGLAVAAGMNAEGGGRNFNFATRATHSSLDEVLRLAWGVQRPRDCFFLRAESFYNVATVLEEMDDIESNSPKIIPIAYGGVSPHERSHGESFFALFKHRFMGNGLYFLDEPESALSPKRQLQFLALLHRYVCLGGQFVIATHSPILMAYPNSRLYEFTRDGLREGRYEETEHFLVTRGFLANPARTLNLLMTDEEAAEEQDDE
jgi:predicted ATPase